jgi:hypothetical protein
VDRAGQVLDSQVGPVRASRIAARHALRIACAAVGGANPKVGHDNTLVFDLDFPGGTLLELSRKPFESGDGFASNSQRFGEAPALGRCHPGK